MMEVHAVAGSAVCVHFEPNPAKSLHIRRKTPLVYSGKMGDIIMKKLAFLLFVWGVFAATGCNAVYAPNPMGDEPVYLNRGKWEGTWTDGEECAIFKVLDAQKGILRIAWIEDSQGQLKYETRDVYLRNAGEHMFASIKEKESFLWAKVKRTGEQVVVWDPDVEKFKAMVREGKLPGKIDDNNNIILDDLTPEHVSIIASESEGLLFDLQNPQAVIRIIQ
jgi:hypothetical protein